MTTAAQPARMLADARIRTGRRIAAVIRNPDGSYSIRGENFGGSRPAGWDWFPWFVESVRAAGYRSARIYEPPATTAPAPGSVPGLPPPHGDDPEGVPV